ncbi:MAG: flagellar basal body-associated FliL family protein [Desulfovibrionaceae bacterium]|nr:flagellar basal body-associated FliL family protein [Desulfovibrionaceae bacterium]
MADKRTDANELKELTDEQFENTDFWSEMLDEPEDPSFVERPDRTEGFLDDTELPVQTEDLTTQQSEQDVVDEETDEEKQKKKRYLLILSLVSLILLLIGGVLTYKILFNEQEDVKSEEGTMASPSQGEEREEVKIETKEVEYFSTAWEPFWLRLQRDGKEVFVTLSFTTITTTPSVLQEMQHKEVMLRDAVYYYLQNITLSTNKETIEKIKHDIVDILNTYISSGSIESLGIETFFIQ